MPRELIEPHKGDKRFVRRSKAGRFKEAMTPVLPLPPIAARRLSAS
jgi:hypothetical protein